MTQLSIPGTDSLQIYHPNVLLISRQEFSLLEKRILFLIYEQVKPLQSSHYNNNEDQMVVEIPNAREKAGSPSWKNWTSTLKLLTGRHYSMIDPKGQSYDGAPFFARVQYHNNRGTLLLILNAELKQAWLDMSLGYTKQMLDSCLNLTSAHAVSIYNFICRYDQGKVVEVDWLKEYLDIEGKYPNCTDFKRRVLDLAKRDIDDNSDYVFFYKIVSKRHKKVHEIKMWGEPKTADIDPLDKEWLTKAMDDISITDRDHRTFIFNHADDFVDALKKTHKAGQKTAINNRGAYVLKIMGLVD